MKQGQKFTDERVRGLKLAMIRGASDTALARVERVSALTMRRMRLGETYAHVVVEGEETLRPPIDVKDYVPEGVQVAKRTENYFVPEMSEAELEASLQRVMIGIAVKPKNVEDEFLVQARNFGAK